jgi:hypothetical protein
MTEDQITTINSDYMLCQRLAKGLIVVARGLGKQLNDLMPEVSGELPETDDDEAYFAAQDAAWTALLTKTFGIPPDTAFALADFSIMPEVQQAPATPAQTMSLHHALRVLAYLVPVDPDGAD